jgi:membrane fusion protein, copper/silver efflux system
MSDQIMNRDDNDVPPGVHTMAIVRWVIVGLMALAAFGALAYSFQWFKPSSSARSAAQTEYYCPMHPSVVQDHPGECPICSMTLVPRVKSGGGHTRHTDAASRGNVAGLAPVQLSPERIQLIGLKTATAVRQALATEIRTVGYVTPREDGLAHIHTRFSGWIEQLLVSQTGEKVSKGQVLANIYSPELLTAQQEFLNARRWSSHAPAAPAEGHAGEPHGETTSLESDARKRLENLGISASEIDELVRTGNAQRAQKIRSPVDGYVVAKNALQGVYVQPETELFQVANLSTVWVLVDVYEYEVSRVQVGSPVRIQVESYPDETFTGKVRFVYPTLSPETRTMRVRLELPNRNLRLKPGMYATVFIQAAPQTGVVVPSSAVVDTGDERYVFVAQGDGRYEPRKVTVGFRSDDKTELRGGVQEGEQVVTTANFMIDSESRLRAAIEGQGGGAGAGGVPPSACDRDFDKARYPEKYQQCRACELQHQGMGEMVTECKNTIPKPWR